jgi:hypothetical protein
VAVSGVNAAFIFSTGEPGTDDDAFSTPSYTPTADRLLIAYVENSKSSTPDTPTFSGNGLTWDQLVTYLSDVTGTQHRLTIFVAKSGSSPSTGAATADFATLLQSGCTIIVDEFNGADLTGTALAAIVQHKTGPSSGSATSVTITLDNAIGAGNATYGGIHHQQNEGNNPGTGYTELKDGVRLSPTSASMTEYRADGQQAVDASWTTSGLHGGIALEIKAAGSNPTSAVWIQ